MTKSFQLLGLCVVGALFFDSSSARAEPATGPQVAPERQQAYRAREDEDAPRLYREASAAAEAENFPEARRLLVRLMTIRPTYDVATSLGQVELKLNMPREAAEHLDFALRSAPPQFNETDLQPIREDFAQAKKLVGTLLVIVDAPGAELSADGKPIGKAPLAAPVFLEPGTHTVVAELGQKRAVKTVKAVAGGTETLRLGLAEPEPGRAEPERSSHSALKPALLITGGALVLAGAGVGIGYALAAGKNTDHAESLTRDQPESACNPALSPAAWCNDLREAQRAYDRNRNVSTVGFVFGGAALVGTLGYWWFSRASEPRAGTSAHPVQLGASATNRETTLWLSGAF